MRQIQVSGRPVRCLTYSPDGTQLATGDEENFVRLWSLPEGVESEVLKDLDDSSVETIAFHPSGQFLAAGLARGDVAIWDLASKKALSRANSHRGGVRTLAWNPGRDTLASGGWDQMLRLWKTPQLGFDREPIKTTGPVMGLAWASDGQTLVSVTNSGMLSYHRFGPHRVEELALPRGLFSLAMAPEGAVFATGDVCGEIILWRLPSAGEKIRTLQGHEWTVYGLAFTPDGGKLVSGSADGTVRLWEVNSGRLAETYRWHSRWVTCVGVSPDGMTAAAGSADGTVVVWDLADV